MGFMKPSIIMVLPIVLFVLKGTPMSSPKALWVDRGLTKIMVVVPRLYSHVIILRGTSVNVTSLDGALTRAIPLLPVAVLLLSEEEPAIPPLGGRLLANTLFDKPTSSKATKDSIIKLILSVPSM